MDFYSHLEKYLKIEEIEKLKLSFNEEDKHAVLLNLSKIGDEEFLSKYPNVKRHPLVEHAYIFDKNEYDLGKTIEHELGCFYIQEPSAMIVSSLIDFKDEDIVLDMCSAPGGKAIQASLKKHGKGVIYANDLSKERAFSIINNEERLGLTNLLVTNNDFSKITDYYLEYFDKIILDAPCSGSGMFRKADKMIQDWSYNKVLKFAEIQKELIMSAYQMLKPGGILSYSTCSYSYEEDEEVIEFLLKNTDAEIIKIPNSKFLYEDNKNYGVHLFPFYFEGEGQYIAQIKKPGESKQKKFVNENHYHKYLEEEYLTYQVNCYNSVLFMLPENVETKKLNILRYGVKVGELGDGFIKYEHHYSRALQNFENEIEINEDEVKSYLLGNVINYQSNIKGYILLKYKNKSVELGKSDTRIIKNNYPKGLRKKYL